MPRVKAVRLALFAAVALAHLLVILFAAFKVNTAVREAEPAAEVMKLVDLQEAAPPPPPPRERPPVPVQNTVEAVAETMIETDDPPPAEISAESLPPVRAAEIEYLPMHKISVLPEFSEQEIRDALVYPPIARRSNIEGMVYLELFVDLQGEVRRVSVIKEEPAGRGFGEAAAKAFEGLRGRAALANGVPVAVRYRYPVRFTLR